MSHPRNTEPGRRAAVELTVDELVERALAMAGSGRRQLLGITGAPGAGKSTLCTALVKALGERAVIVGMDGFHLDNHELSRLGRRQRKGAHDTFDVDGFTALLHRLRDQLAEVIYAPRFDRALDESVGSAIPVGREVPLVITEGNYLLLDQHGWGGVHDALDEVWFLDVAAETRVERLVRRRHSFGDTPDHAEAWVLGVDQANASVVDSSRERADLLVNLTTRLGRRPSLATVPPGTPVRSPNPKEL